MKLISLLEDNTRTKLLHLQQLVIEHYLDGVVEAELEMLPAHDGPWAPKVPVLEIKVDLGYWKNVVRAVYGRQTSLGYVAVSQDGADGAFYLTLDPSNVLKRFGFDCEFENVSHFPAWFEGSLVDDQNWHTSLITAFAKHHNIKKMPLNFSQADSCALVDYLLTTEVVVEHTSGRWLPSIDQLDGDERSKTHRAVWKAWNETPVTSQYNDAYIIWVKK